MSPWADPTVVVGGGVFVVAVTSILALVARLARSVPKAYEEQIKQMGDRIYTLELQNLRCEHRLNLVIRAMQVAGLKVPDEVFEVTSADRAATQGSEQSR